MNPERIIHLVAYAIFFSLGFMISKPGYSVDKTHEMMARSYQMGCNLGSLGLLEQTCALASIEFKDTVDSLGIQMGDLK